MIIEKLVAELGWDLTGEADLKRFKSGMADAEKGLATFVARAGALAAAAGAAFAAGMGALGKAVISTSAEFEGYQATLETIEGSADKARASLDWVSEFAKTTPYDVAQVTESFIRMRAYGLDPMDGSLRAVGDAASAMGRTIMDGVEAIADATTGENERLKSFGITTEVAGKKITYTWRENGKELKKTLNKNGVEIAKFLQENFERRFGGAMDKQSSTWNGMVANLGDTWTDFQKRIGEAGFFDAVKGQLDRLLNYIKVLDANGTIDRWAGNLSWAFTRASNVIADFAERMGRHFATIARVIDENKGAWGWLKWVLGAIAIRMFPLAFALGALALAIEDFLHWLGGGKSVIGDFVTAMEDFLGLDRGELSAIAGTLLGFSGLAIAALGIGAFTLSLSPLTAALGAFTAAFLAAKEGFEYLKSLKTGLDNKISGIKATSNPRAQPGYIESSGYDENGKFIYMDGSRRVDRPAENTTAGFTQDALDYKFMLQNAEENLAKMGAGQAGAAVENTINDSRQTNVTTSIVQNIQQASQAPGAAAQATAAAVNGVARSSGLPPSRIAGTGAF